MTDYRVNLDIFAGPLDLLLYLVRKEEVDIYDIPITKITDQYLHYIEMIKSLDIDLASDFLVMAATLMQIKSAMLLPKADPGQFEDEDLTDPRTELIRQLLEYKKFKDAANLLDTASEEQKSRFARPSIIIDQLKQDSEPEIDIDQVSIWDLLEAFDSIMTATGARVDISHIKDDTPIDLYQIQLLHRLQTGGPMNFKRVFESSANRVVMIGLFLALLELIREELIWAEQDGCTQDIYLRSLTEEPAEQAVQKAVLATAAEEQSVDAQKEQAPPIEISELPPKSKPIVTTDIPQQEQAAIPISELPAQKPSKTSDSEHDNIESSNEQQLTN